MQLAESDAQVIDGPVAQTFKRADRVAVLLLSVRSLNRRQSTPRRSTFEGQS